jgi:hypothetical protein
MKWRVLVLAIAGLIILGALGVRVVKAGPSPSGMAAAPTSTTPNRAAGAVIQRSVWTGRKRGIRHGW